MGVCVGFLPPFVHLGESPRFPSPTPCLLKRAETFARRNVPDRYHPDTYGQHGPYKGAGREALDTAPAYSRAIHICRAGICDGSPTIGLPRFHAGATMGAGRPTKYDAHAGHDDGEAIMRWSHQLFPLLAVASLAVCLTGVSKAQDDDDYVKELKKKQDAAKGKQDTAKDPDVTHKKPEAKEAEPEAKAPEGGTVLKGARVILPEIAEGSWCAGAWNLLPEGGEAEIAGLKVSRDSKAVHLTGNFKQSKAGTTRQAFKPSEFRVTVVDGIEKPGEASIRRSDLAKGVDLEIAGADLRGQVVIRLVETWRGVVWGVLSGFEFKLEQETITLVDADFDGRCSESDRIIYGTRNLWMPWHTVTVSGRTIYHELAIGSATSLTAKTTAMDDPGPDAGIWDKWQAVRKDQGVPPGIFSAKLNADCIKHADYCKANKYRGHEQNPSLPGYSAEGHAAGMSSCIHYLGKGKEEQEMWDFLGSLYHRVQLIDPKDVTLQLGGNDYAFLMGSNSDPKQPAESRAKSAAQLHPAPNSNVPAGDYRRENPTHPILAESRQPGLPVIVRVPTYSPSFSLTDCHLYAVQGDLKAGKRGAEVRCHLCHAGKDAPADFPEMWSMIALTPYEVLKVGTYEASFTFSEAGTSFAFTWRFKVGS